MLGDAFAPVPPSLEVRMAALVDVIERLAEAMQAHPGLPMVSTRPDLYELADVVARRQGLNTADVADAVARALPIPPTPPDAVTGMAEILEALRLLDFRLKGSSGGGGPSNDGIHDRLDTLVIATENRPDEPVLSAFAASTSSATVVAANAARRGLTVFNNNAVANLYLKLGTAAASTSSFTVKVPPGAYFELPHPAYTGAVQGIWDAATGNAAQVTELS